MNDEDRVFVEEVKARGIQTKAIGNRYPAGSDITHRLIAILDAQSAELAALREGHEKLVGHVEEVLNSKDVFYDQEGSGLKQTVSEEALLLLDAACIAARIDLAALSAAEKGKT